MAATVRYDLSRDIPLLHEADVIVVGGGPGGIGAAVMAARAGARTILIERYGFLGGMAVAGEVHPFMENHLGEESLDRPVYQDWLAHMRSYGWQEDATSLPRTWAPHVGLGISKDAAMLAAEDLCLEAGVNLLYHHTLADVIVREREIDALVLLSKSGYTAAKAAVYVDCSGDGDLAARAGCKFEMGGPTGHCQPMTLCFKLSHVDPALNPGPPGHEELSRLYREAVARGEIDCPRENVLQFAWFDADVIHFNTTRVIHKNGTNGAELSEAEVEGRRQMRQFLRFLRKHAPGYAQAQIHSIGHHIGVRETRRILGRAYLTREAFIERRKFPDAVARLRYGIDIHNPDGANNVGRTYGNMPPGEWYEIPYGCLVARDRDNLLVGGRPISADHVIHGSFRVMPCACSIGQAAGLAAAMAASRGCAPGELDGIEVRRRLVEMGAAL